MSESKPIVLRSAANPTIRHLVRMRDNRARRKAGRVIVDGWRETARALEAGLTPCGIYLPESAGAAVDPTSTNTDPVICRVLKHRVLVRLVADSLVDKICYGQSFRGVVAEFERPRWDLDQLQLPPAPLVVLLDRIEKPGNVGAVFRCADAAGVDAILLCESGDIFNPNAIRASLGCVFHVPSASGTEHELAQFLARRSIRVVAARVDSATPLWSAKLLGPLAIVLGSESSGLGERWGYVGDALVEGICIPMNGQADSLNISVSAALLAYEAIRQRTTAGDR